VTFYHHFIDNTTVAISSAGRAMPEEAPRSRFLLVGATGRLARASLAAGHPTFGLVRPHHLAPPRAPHRRRRHASPGKCALPVLRSVRHGSSKCALPVHRVKGLKASMSFRGRWMITRAWSRPCGRWMSWYARCPRSRRSSRRLWFEI
jgi:hypothetical protein